MYSIYPRLRHVRNKIEVWRAGIPDFTILPLGLSGVLPVSPQAAPLGWQVTTLSPWTGKIRNARSPDCILIFDILVLHIFTYINSLTSDWYAAYFQQVVVFVDQFPQQSSHRLSTTSALPEGCPVKLHH